MTEEQYWDELRQQAEHEEAMQIDEMARHIQFLEDEVRQLTSQRDSLAERLIEIEEVSKREDGTLYWSSCGEDV